MSAVAKTGPEAGGGDELKPTPGALLLVVEDEPPLVKFLRASLVANGYRFLHAGTARDAVARVADSSPDLVLLDLGLPDGDGITVLEEIRGWSAAPVIVLSARGHERDKVMALDAGADDYLTKPFSVDELLARVRSALRRASAPAASTEHVFQSGSLVLDLSARRVTVGGADVKLTPIEYKILATLAKHAGKLVTQRHLLDEVWGKRRLAEPHYLRVYMAHLRRKLELDPEGERLFETQAGVGYRLRQLPPTG